MTDIDAVHKRPGMYIGLTDDGTGLHNMVGELVTNAVAEVLAGYADRVDVSLHPDGSCTVRDNGRGIPVEVSERGGPPVAELVLTRLAPPFERGREFRQVPGGHNIGIFVVNALSAWLELRVWRDGNEHFMRFRLGRPDAPLAIVGKAEGARHGTEITFLPSARFLTETRFDRTTLDFRLRDLMAFNPGVDIVLTDHRV